MEPESRNRVSDLYHRALARGPEERARFLRESCEGDEGLLEEVESLLRFESDSARFLERRAVDIVGADTTPARTEMLNRQIGPYTIVAPLGAGGMGEVYRARDSKLGRDVAIKILPSHLTADPERRARFSREARLLATLNHPHIGAIYGLEETDGVTALILELIDGPTLADRLAHGPPPMSEALAIARQIADALEAAHEKGIVHRDLKPANIVLLGTADLSSGGLRVKVLDFGLAKTLVVGPDGDLTQRPPGSLDGTAEGRILGTPAYMSPEQARGQAVDKRTDIWAFGCVLFEMLSGQRPFDGDTVTDTFARILEHEPDWSVVPAQTPGSIRTLLEKCLRKDPRLRLHDIADARIELEDRPHTPVTGVSPGEPRLAPRRHLKRIAWLGAAGVAAAWMGIAVFNPRGRPAAPAEPVSFSIAAPEGGRLRSFAVSPDGRHVVLVVFAGGVSRLWVRSLASPEMRLLQGTEEAGGPFWRRDSAAIGFFAGGMLKTVQLNGSAPVVLCAVRLGGYIGGAWSDANVIVFMASDATLWQVSAVQVGGTPRQITTLAAGDAAHQYPRFLPDGQHFLYLAQRSQNSEVRIGSLASAETVSLGSFESQAAYAAGHLFFVRGGNLMAQPFDAVTRQLTGDPVLINNDTGIVFPPQLGLFSVSANTLAYRRDSQPTSQLTWFDRRGTVVGTVGAPGRFFHLDLSFDGRRVAVSRQIAKPGSAEDSDIWIVDLDQNRWRRLTEDPGFEGDPAWSRDGTRVAFYSTRVKARVGLFVRPSDGSGQDTPLAMPEGSGNVISAPDWAPGDTLVYTKRADSTGPDLWTMTVKDDPVEKVFLKTPHQEIGGVFSPNGRWIAYYSDASGRNEVYVRPFPIRDGVLPISRDGGLSPRWRRDGKEIFFLALDGVMMAADVDASNLGVAGVPRPLFPTHLTSGTNYRPYAVSPDGQRFLFPRPGPESPVRVVANWQAMLRK